MYYELYVDSLFLINFGMNLYLLLLVNRSLFSTATRRRLILGAVIGALFYFLPFFCKGPRWFRFLLGIPGGGIAMIVVAFRVKTINGFLTVLEKMLVYSILMGGTMLLLCRIPGMNKWMSGLWGVLGVGALLYLLLEYLGEKRGKENHLKRVTLVHGGNQITVKALLDSGNSLVEPISGKPVSIVEKAVLESLWLELPSLYRAIPYHSIGKKRGILKGYLVPEIRIEAEGVMKICKNTYVAVCEEYITSEERDANHVKMILNPRLLEETNIERYG